MIENDVRSLVLSLGGGAINGIAYGVVLFGLEPLGLPFSAIVGAMVGLLCAPVVMYALGNKLVLSAAKVLVPVSTSVTVASAVLIAPPLSMAFSIGGFISVALILRFCAKNRWGPKQCQVCGYNLRGLTEPRCPECGTPFEKSTMSDAVTGEAESGE